MAKQRTRPAEERFWEKVSKDAESGCWLWMAGCFADGYGAFNATGKPMRAHRFSYKLAHGICPDEMDVLHSCDTPKCVNPAHLELGDHQQNMADMGKRGRAARNFKVTDGQVAEIRASLLPLKKLAAIYGVSVGLVGAIRSKAGHRAKDDVRMSRRAELAQQGVYRPRKP